VICPFRDLGVIIAYVAGRMRAAARCDLTMPIGALQGKRRGMGWGIILLCKFSASFMMKAICLLNGPEWKR
jgi:hypothetical protein